MNEGTTRVDAVYTQRTVYTVDTGREARNEYANAMKSNARIISKHRECEDESKEARRHHQTACCCSTSTFSSSLASSFAALAARPFEPTRTRRRQLQEKEKQKGEKLEGFSLDFVSQ